MALGGISGRIELVLLESLAKIRSFRVLLLGPMGPRLKLIIKINNLPF